MKLYVQNTADRSILHVSFSIIREVRCMKIENISLGCTDAPQSKNLCGNSAFILFRTPVIITADGREYQMKKSSAMLISSGTRWFFRSMRRTPPKYDLVELTLTPSDKQDFLSLELSLDTPVEVFDDHVISNLIKCMKLHSVRTKSTCGDFFTLTMRAVFEALCSEIKTSEHYGNKRSVPHLAELKLLRETIYESPMNQWSASECAANMGISRAYFHRIYFAAFGVTFVHDTIESRLMYAAELLKTTDLSVNAIAEKCGYDNDSYFMRQFKKHRGCTPTEFRSL